ncbi:MAG: NUDIX hydrolase [Actinomycetota bacterium]|nr:NUDIX hydrolase [Actinomycetota bacterium]
MAKFWIDRQHSKIVWPSSDDPVRYLKIERVAIANSDSEELGYRDVIRHPGAVVIVAYLEQLSSVLFIKQYRAALDREVVELPAGKRDVAGEPPIVCAARELAEELGVAATYIEPLITFYNTPGFCDEETQVFLARGLSSVDIDPQSPEEKSAIRMIAPLEKIESLISDGVIIDGKTLLGLFALKSRVAAGLSKVVSLDSLDLDQFVSI